MMLVGVGADDNVVVRLVPRTGGTATAVVVCPGSGQRRPVAQTRPDKQQPPMFTGHGVKFAAPLQANVDCRLVFGSGLVELEVGAAVVVVIVVETVLVVVTGITTMLDVDVLEEEGEFGVMVSMIVTPTLLTQPTSKQA